MTDLNDHLVKLYLAVREAEKLKFLHTRNALERLIAAEKQRLSFKAGATTAVERISPIKPVRLVEST